MSEILLAISILIMSTMTNAADQSHDKWFIKNAKFQIIRQSTDYSDSDAINAYHIIAKAWYPKEEKLDSLLKKKQDSLEEGQAFMVVIERKEKVEETYKNTQVVGGTYYVYDEEQKVFCLIFPAFGNTLNSEETATAMEQLMRYTIAARNASCPDAKIAIFIPNDFSSAFFRKIDVLDHNKNNLFVTILGELNFKKGQYFVVEYPSNQYKCFMNIPLPGAKCLDHVPNVNEQKPTDQVKEEQYFVVEHPSNEYKCFMNISLPGATSLGDVQNVNEQQPTDQVIEQEPVTDACVVYSGQESDGEEYSE